MASTKKLDVTKKIATLQVTFKNQLPDKITEIQSLWEDFYQDQTSDTHLLKLHLIASRLVGTTSTYGAEAVSIVARELANVLKILLTEYDHTQLVSARKQQQVEDIFIRLRQVMHKWQPSDIPYIEPNEFIVQREINLIYLFEEDEQLARGLILKIEQAGYRVQYISELSAIEPACEKEIPAAIIIGVVFDDGNIMGAELLTRLKDKVTAFPPTIFISEQDDIEARLAAARAGASRYFCKPMDVTMLVQALDALTTQIVAKPYRVLFVDDDEHLLKFYTLVLSNAGIEVKTLSNPMECFKYLPDFKPDVLVLDVYMPECSGHELAQVVRQDETWAQMPIMFVSLEPDLNQQLVSMGFDYDDFLSKPVNPGRLVSAIVARAKRARLTNRLNQDLQRALRESEFHLVTMNQHDIVSTADATGRITSVNDKFCEISGYRREELLGQNHRMVKSDHHDDSFYKDMWRTISLGKIWRGVICNRKKNGDVYWVESTIVPFLDDKGHPYKYISARTDVTALRQSEERLHRSQVFANIGTWDWNITTGDLYWSDGIGPLFGYGLDVPETTYENFLAAVHPDDRQKVVDAVNNCVEHGTKYNIEHRVVWPDASVHWVQEKGDVIRDADNKPLHMLGVVMDIHERKLAEDAQRESEEKYRRLFELSEDPMWMIQKEQFVMANKAAANILGYDSIKTLNDVHPSELSPEYQPDKQRSFDKANKMMSIAYREGYHRFEWSYKKKDGVEFPVEVSLTRVPYEGRDGLFCVWRDITERKQAEQKLLSAKEDAENANQAKSQFLSSMSHELRTPMNAIMGFSQLLKLDKVQQLSDSQEENVDEIIRAGKHLLELINEVLDLTRIEAGRIDLIIETVVLGEVVAEALQLILPLAQRRGIEINLLLNDVEVTFDELLIQNKAIQADRIRLRQVLLNLLSNAVKYNCDNGKVTIACKQADNNQIRISITDTGAGLNQEQQSQLFKAFNRLGAEQTEIEGAGIGLVITENIVQLMDGKIGVESQPGKGSTFWIEFPSANDYSLQENPVDKKQATQTQAVVNSEHEHTVLYIEDNPANLRLVTQLMGRLPNIHMWSAPDPYLGLELAEEHKPDLILLDINLPGMDGYEVLEHLQQKESTRNTPVIAISANAMTGDIKRGIDAGFGDYITKPIDVVVFMEAVDKAL